MSPANATRWAGRVIAAPFRALRLGLMSTDRLIRATVIAAMILVVLTSYTLYVSAQGRAGIDAQRRSDEITACRSEVRAPIDRAAADLEATRVLRDDGLIAGLVAAVTDDRATLDRVIVEARQIRAEALADLDALQVATAEYSAAVELSRTDPAAFLAGCKARSGP